MGVISRMMNRIRTGVFLFTLLISLPLLSAEEDLIKVDSTSSAADTIDTLKLLIEQAGYEIYSVFDHGDKKNMKQVISFGNTSMHGQIMWHDSAASLELPFKIAVHEDEMGDVTVIYRKPTALRKTYNLEACGLLDKMDRVLAELAEYAAE